MSPGSGLIKPKQKKESFVAFNLNDSTTQVIATTAIGQEYFANWESFSYPSWLSYAKRHNLGIIVVTEDIILPSDSNYKNGSWQKMLIPGLLASKLPKVERVCLLDTDVIISPRAPNIFEIAPLGRYSVVSQEKNLPYDLAEVRRRVSFLRNRNYSSSYPLDSLVLADAKEVFRQQGLPERDDYFCTGLIVCDASHAPQLREWFQTVDTVSADGAIAWEETYLNHWIQGTEPFWLPYSFQALWHYEMAWYHPHLYMLGDKISQSHETKRALEAGLWNSYFLHFAGSWHESLAWGASPELFMGEKARELKDFGDYLLLKIPPKNYGKLSPASGNFPSRESNSKQ